MNIFSGLYHYFISLDEQGSTYFYVHLKNDMQAMLSQIEWVPGDKKARCKWISFDNGIEKKYEELEVNTVVWGKILSQTEFDKIMQFWKFKNIIEKVNENDYKETYEILGKIILSQPYIIPNIIAHCILSQNYGNQEHHRTQALNMIEMESGIRGKILKQKFEEILKSLKAKDASNENNTK